MVTLVEIKRLCRVEYPGCRHDLSRLLVAWAKRDPAGELGEILLGTGLELEGLIEALEPLFDARDSEDLTILKRVVFSVNGTGATGKHLLSTLADTPQNHVTAALVARGLDRGALRAKLADLEPSFDRAAMSRIEQPKKSEKPLRKFGRDLLLEARQGAFDDLYERTDDINRILEVILRRLKRNPALTGPAGVGKTALVELLARAMARAEIPALEGYALFEISTGRLVGGTRYRGDFEARMVEILEALEKLSPALLYIDELHTIVGAGRAEGIITDASNILKPYLARGVICLIGATTTEEFHRHIARGDAALARRFQELRIEEPRDELCAAMVEAQARAVANHHGISVPREMVAAAIELTDRHLPHRVQPDKAATLIDSAAAQVRRLQGEGLSRESLMKVLAEQTGRPIELLGDDDRESLVHLTNRIKEHIIGQGRAVELVAETLICRRQDLASEDRPLGRFLFAGDTGVGKTEMARVLAREFYGDETALLHLDLAEYAEGSSLNKLIGAPAGYVGSDSGNGVIVDWLHQRSAGLILLDEAEKAATEVLTLVLGLLDNGRITSARGERCDAKQCVIVLTTNAASSRELERTAVGFGAGASSSPFEALSAYFPRELLARLDEIIVFESLDEETLRRILSLRLSEATGRLEQKRRLELDYDEESLIDWLMVDLKGARTGARGIERLIERKLLQPLALALVRSAEREKSSVALGESFYESGEIQITPADLGDHQASAAR